MILDEPTNDLDVDTLELLEDLLNQFDGTLLLVSHDRAFLDNIVTSTLVFEEDGVIGEYVGGYEDWLRQRRVIDNASKGSSNNKEKNIEEDVDVSSIVTAKKRKLSYKETTELAKLPELIEELEEEKGTLEVQVGDSAFYQQDKEIISESLQRLDAIGKELEQSYARWEELAEHE